METVAVLELKRILMSYMGKSEPSEVMVDGQNIHTYHVKITPSLATTLLTRAGVNRNLSRVAIRRYVTAMKNNEWSYNGAALSFDTNGKLIDGQHRLNAIVESGKTLPFKIELGYNPEAFITLDIGKVRTGGDILTIAGVKDGRLASTTANFIFNFSRNKINSRVAEFRLDNSLSLSHTQLLDFYKNNTDITTSINYCLGVKKKMGRNFKTTVPFFFLTGFHFLFSQKDQALADSFIFKLITGENLAMDSSIYRLRERLALDVDRNKADKLNNLDKSKLFVIAWNSFRKGKSVKSLKLTEMLPIIE